MAIGDAYATPATYRAVVGKTDASADTGALADDLLAISRYLDLRLGRSFSKDTAVTLRTYYPRGENQRRLFVEDIASTVGLIVKVDDNRDGVAEVTLVNPGAGVGGDFELLPLNAAVGAEPDPYTMLYLPPRVSRSYWWEKVEVTAIHGYPNVPKAIERATIQLTGILRLESPRATARIPEAVDAAIGASTTAQRIVDHLIDAYDRPAWAFS